MTTFNEILITFLYTQAGIFSHNELNYDNNVEVNSMPMRPLTIH